jgi:hypothetical protein
MSERKKRLVSRRRFLEMVAGTGGAALLTGCGGGLFTQEPTSTPTRVPEPPPLPAPTMTPTTEVSPTATATVTATPTEVPATPTETVTPTQEVEVVHEPLVSEIQKPSEITDDVRVFGWDTGQGRQPIAFGLSTEYRPPGEYFFSGILMAEPTENDNGEIDHLIGIPDPNRDAFKLITLRIKPIVEDYIRDGKYTVK